MTSGGLKALAKRLAFVAEGKDRDAAVRVAARPLDVLVRSEVAKHVRSGALQRSMEVVGNGGDIDLNADYDGTYRSRRTRISKATGKVLAPRKGRGPAVYFRFGGHGRGGPDLSFKRGFTRRQKDFALKAFIELLMARLRGS